MAQSQLPTAGPKFRRSGNFFFLKCFGFPSKRKTNFKKKSPTTKSPHWFHFSSKKSKTHRSHLPSPLKPSWTPPPVNSEDPLSKLTINKLIEQQQEQGKFQNQLFSDKSETAAEKKISKSAPIILPLAPPPPPAEGKGVKKNARSHRKSKGKVDPAVGFFIVTLNLVIMLVWGKVCAILCASAFLYIVPRFRTSSSSSSVQVFSEKSGKSEDDDNDSIMVKKKVIFDGFLERKRRISFGHL